MENYLKNSKSSIYNALLKYGHSNFSLTVMDYCSPSRSEQCIEREDFYLSSLKHEYNICEKAGSRKGQTLNEESKKKMSEAKQGKSRPEGAGLNPLNK